MIETDILYEIDNVDVMLGVEKINSFESELANTINGSGSHNDTKAFSHPRGDSSQENEIRNINAENEIHKHDDRLLESMEIFSNLINIRLFEEMDGHDAFSDQ